MKGEPDMTIEEARAIIKRDKDRWNPFEELMNPDYMPEYSEACNVCWDWEQTHGTNKKGKIFYKRRCPKCGGSGHLACYGHIDHGQCWRCGGTGYIEAYE